MEIPDTKDLLLVKCRDTIKQMEMKILSEKSARKQSEAQNKDLHNELSTLQSHCLTLQSKFKEKESGMQDYIDQLEAQLEKEQEKLSEAEIELQKFSEFVFELQDELKAKQDALVEWNEAVCEIEQKIFDLSKENQELKEKLAKLTKKLENSKKTENFSFVKEEFFRDDKFECLRMKLAQHLGVDLKTTDEELLKLVDNNKRQLVLSEKEKKDFGSKAKELSEKCESLKKLYEHKLDEEQKKMASLQKTQEKTEEKLQKKIKKIRNLSLSSQSPNFTCSTPSSSLQSDLESLKKNEIIQIFKEKIAALEQSSARELDYLKSGIESLKDCFRLEISKKEQEMVLKFQPYEQELLQEIQNLQDECVKLKTHYNKLLQYKEEEKSLLEQDKIKLKNIIHGMQYRSKTPANDSRLCFYDLADSSEINPMNLVENSKGYRLEAEKESFKQVLDKKEKEFLQFKKNFDKRWEKKIKETQEKISAWKVKLREDISAIKKVIGTDKIIVAVERLERSVGLII